PSDRSTAGVLSPPPLSALRRCHANSITAGVLFAAVSVQKTAVDIHTAKNRRR
ncbi:hypothetical protein A2U01_0070380, partial [Trifolium medium]|nr:hypothetical protein [Trifolium medium]